MHKQEVIMVGGTLIPIMCVESQEGGAVPGGHIWSLIRTESGGRKGGVRGDWRRGVHSERPLVEWSADGRKAV